MATKIFLPAHSPAAQTSKSVQALASLQGAVLFTCVQPSLASQPSSLQGFPSSQLIALPTHAPPLQTSPVVQEEPSSQGVSKFLNAHRPLVPSQASWVHGLPSSHLSGPPGTQALALHRSPTVHLLPSSQGWLLSLCPHPVARSQESWVHGFLSSQLTPWPTQLPSAQTSFSVQAVPSVHGTPAALAVNLHLPSKMLHLDSMQNSADLHSLPLPETHLPTAQASPTVQRFSSSQAKPSKFVTVQPVAGSQLSLVQSSASSQTMALPIHNPPLQASPVVHTLLSVHTVSSAIAGCRHSPVFESQLSLVQGFLSSQSSFSPGTHLPPTQRSTSVQPSPSVQPTVLMVLEQPVATSQASSVHGFLSSQLTVAPAHSPTAQVSFSVHLLLSLQPKTLFTLTQPDFLSQLSSVHTLASSQTMAAPAQLPKVQMSSFVQAELSSQALVFWAWAQALPSQLSSVQAFKSSQALALMSSVVPLQSSSTPLQVSVAGFGASQTLKPISPQVLTPPHFPTTLPSASSEAAKHAVCNFAFLAASLHAHSAFSGTQTEPLAAILSKHL